MISTIDALTREQVEALSVWLREFNSSGISAKFSGNLTRLSSFTGKEYGTLAQVMPLALLHLGVDPLLITAWCLVSEVPFFSLARGFLALRHSPPPPPPPPSLPYRLLSTTTNGTKRETGWITNERWSVEISFFFFFF